MVKMNDKTKTITVFCTFETVVEIDEDMSAEEIEEVANDVLTSDEMLQGIVDSGFHINSN